MRKTVNLSRARVASQQHRAKKAVSILKNEFSEDAKISRELNEEIWSRGAKKPPRKVTVEETDGVLYPVAQKGEVNTTSSEDTEDESETEESEDTEESSDYSDIVDNNIGDVKDRVDDLEEPDFEALLEAEEAGKDRKTLKEWFESQK